MATWPCRKLLRLAAREPVALIFLLTAPSNSGRVRLISDIEDGRLIPANEDNQSITELLRSPRASSINGRPVLISFVIPSGAPMAPEMSAQALESSLFFRIMSRISLAPSVLDAFFARPPRSAGKTAPITASEITALTGTYVFGTGAADRIEITEKNGILIFTRLGKSARNLIHAGDLTFRPVGAASAKVHFSGAGENATLTVEDPGVMTGAWSGTVTYRRPIDDWAESVCAENTREYYAGKDTAIPVAQRPDF